MKDDVSTSSSVSVSSEVFAPLPYSISSVVRSPTVTREEGRVHLFLFFTVVPSFTTYSCPPLRLWTEAEVVEVRRKQDPVFTLFL